MQHVALVEIGGAGDAKQEDDFNIRANLTGERQWIL